MEHLIDKLAIGELINGWIYRDLGQWDQLLTLFHPEGTIEVTWFEGRFHDFVRASASMQSSPIATKHLTGTPLIVFNPQGDKALAETNAMIVTENATLKLGSSTHSRFYDYVEKRDDRWRLLRRQCIYDFASFSFPAGPVAIDPEVAGRYPLSYAPLAYLLEKSGFPVGRVFATKNSAQETAMRAEALRWLNAV